jgi:lipopolysaccharide export LptBFGC system permease protein LptF
MKTSQIACLVASLAIAGLTLLLQELVVSSTERDAVATMERSPKPEKTLKKDNITYYDIVEETQPNGTKIKNLTRFFYAHQFDGQNMSDALAIDRSQNRVSRIIRAKSATLGSGKKNWDFYNGTVYEIDPKSQEPKTIKQFKRLRVSPGQTPLTLAVPDRLPEKSASKQDNIIYAQIAEETQPNGLKVKNLERFFYTRKFDGQKMTDVMTIDLSQRAVINVTDARSGKWDVSKKNWDLSNGTTYTIDLKSKSLMKTKFDRFQIQYL